MIKKTFVIVLLLLINSTMFAQNGTDIAMADEMRSNGKIYVVVAVVLTILFGIIIYLVRLDRKISKIEKNNS